MRVRRVRKSNEKKWKEEVMIRREGEGEPNGKKRKREAGWENGKRRRVRGERTRKITQS